MVSVNQFMTQVMNSPTVFIGGLAIGYVICMIKQKFGGGMGGMGGI
jgi:hypothetical protein